MLKLCDDFLVYRFADGTLGQEADIVFEMTIKLSGPAMLTVCTRAHSVAWAGMGDPSFSDLQWLDGIREALGMDMEARG